MARERAIQDEVRLAVRDYVDQLISERRAPGCGMAVSAHDLMVATKAAGHHANRKEADAILDAFVGTGLKIIKETPRAPYQSKYNPHKTQKKTDAPKTSKKDYHWLAWPSPSSTPEPTPPSTPVPQSARPLSKRELARAMIPPRPASAAPTNEARPSSARPGSAVPRPKTASSMRAPTPRIPTPAPAVPLRAPTPSLPPTPTPDPGEGVAEFYKTPEPTLAHMQHGLNERPVSVLSYRSATPAAGAATPREFDPDFRDPMVDAQVTNKAALGNGNQSLEYVPGLQAWVTNANDYEREVAYNLLQAIKTSGRKRSGYRRGKSTAVRHPTAGVKTSYSVWDHYKNAGWDDKEMMIAGKGIGLPPGADYYMYQKHGSRPGVAKHQPKLILPKEYTCEASFFQPSNRPFKRDYVINPEWASESNKMRRNLSLLMSTKGPNGFRYSSK